MLSNSTIFTTNVFGTSSGKTQEDQCNTDRETQEKYLQSVSTSTMGTIVPKVPSNQQIMKD